MKTCERAGVAYSVCDESSSICDSFGLGGSGDIFVIFASFVTLILGGMILMGGWGFVKASRSGAPEFYLVSTRARPELHRAEGVEYHLFLRCVWLASALKRQLLR
eukprot:6214500-Pleurochrysis_carterae.AAC.6